MKKTRFTALVLALVMCICSVPFATAEGDSENVISFETGAYAVYGKNYFTVGYSVYDKLGNYVGEIPEEDLWDHPVHTIGDNCIITLDSYLDAVEGYSIYNVENGNIVKKSSYPLRERDALNYVKYNVMDFSDGKFTVIQRTKVTFGSPEDGSYAPSVGREEPAGYVLLDAYGNEVYSSTEDRALYVNGGVLVVEDDDGNSHICTNLYADELVFEEFPYNVVYATEAGDLVVEEEGKYGVVDWSGDEILDTQYEEIRESGNYLLGVEEYSTDVYMRCSQSWWTWSEHISGKVIEYNDHDVCLAEKKDGVYRLYVSSKPIDEGDIASCDENIFYIASSETNSGKLYDDRGNLILSGEGTQGEFTSDADAGIVVGSFDSESYAVYDMEGELIRELECDRAYTAQNGYIVLEDSKKDVEWIEKDGKAVTGKHKYCKEYFEMAGCDVFVMDNDGGFTVYVAKKHVPFNDVDESHWAYMDIAAACGEGIMNGVGDGMFNPAGTVTRAQAVTALWRMAGCPAPVENDEPGIMYPQVWEDWWNEWYGPAFLWALSVKITLGVNGIHDSKAEIAANREITRGEVAMLMGRYAQIVDKRFVDYTAIDESSFEDIDDVPAWCDMGFSCATGIINGKSIGGKLYLAPNDTLTRAELAAILERY